MRLDRRSRLGEPRLVRRRDQRGNERTFAGNEPPYKPIERNCLSVDGDDRSIKRRQRIDCITGNIEIPTRSNVNSTRAVNTRTVCHHRFPIGIVVLRRGSADIHRPGNMERCHVAHTLFLAFLGKLARRLNWKLLQSKR